MKRAKIASGILLLVCIFTISLIGSANATVKIKTKSGKSYTVPVNGEDVLSITFEDGQAPVSGGVETLTVSNERAEKVTSKTVLKSGRWYIIEASGTFDDWGNAVYGVDAVWCFAEWRCGKEGQVWDQLRINDKGMTELAGKPIPYNPEHVYRIRIKGEGKPLVLHMWDAQGSAGDNKGEVTVRIIPE